MRIRQLKLVSPIVLCVITVACVSLLAWLNIKHFEKTIITQTQQNLLTITQTEAMHIENVFSNIQSKLEILALNPTVQKRTRQNIGTSEVSADGYNPLKDFFKHSEDTIDSVYRLDSKGMMLERIPFEPGCEGTDFSKKPDVKFVSENHKPYNSEVFTVDSGSKAISVCVPVFESEEFIGILCTSVRLDTVNDIVSHIEAGQKGYAQIIDDDGIMVAHPKAGHIGKNIITTRKKAFPNYDWCELESVVSRMTSGEEGIGSYHSAWWQDEQPQLIRKLTAFAPIRIGNELWSIGVSMGYDEILGPIEAHSRNVFIVVACFICILTAAGAVYYKIDKKRSQIEAHTAISRVNEELQLVSTEREQTVAKLRQQKNLLHNIISAIPYCIFWKDTNSIYQGCNKKFAEAAGVNRPEDIVGKNDYDLPWKAEQAAYFIKCDAEIIKTGIPLLNMKGKLRAAGGNTIDILTGKVPLRDASGKIIGILGIYTDIAKLKGSVVQTGPDGRVVRPDTGQRGIDNTEPEKDTKASDSIAKTEQAHVLVVDDSPENRLLVETLLSKAGHKTTLSCDGKEAVALAAKQKFDLILMDMRLAVMDGFKAAEIIKSQGLNSTTAIIAMTTSDATGDKALYFEAGCDGYISKSIKPEVLLDKIQRFVRHTKQSEIAAHGGDITSFFAGDPTYQKMINMFIDNLPKRLKQMQEALDEGNLQELAYKIHTLKGLGSFAGFPIYTEKAKALEQAVMENQIDKVREQLDEMVQLCLRTKLTRH